MVNNSFLPSKSFLPYGQKRSITQKGTKLLYDSSNSYKDRRAARYETRRESLNKGTPPKTQKAQSFQDMSEGFVLGRMGSLVFEPQSRFFRFSKTHNSSGIMSKLRIVLTKIIGIYILKM